MQRVAAQVNTLFSRKGRRWRCASVVNYSNRQRTRKHIEVNMPAFKASFYYVACLAFLLGLVFVDLLPGRSVAFAQSPKDERLLVTPEALTAKIDAVTKATGLDEGIKTKLLELYRKSLNNLATAADYDTLAQKFAQSLETAPAEVKKLKDARDRLLQQNKRQAQPEAIAASASFKETEQQLLQAKASYEAIDTEVAALTRKVADLTERPAKAGKRLAEIKEREQALLAARQEPLPETTSPQLSQAQAWQQQTELQMLHSETGMLNQELVSMPVLVELTNVQREEATARLETARSQVQALEAEVNRKRQEEATQSMGQAQEAMRQVAGSQPVLQQVAARNAELGKSLQAVTSALQGVSTEKETLEKELKRVEGNFTNTKQKIALAGLSQALGFLLHEQRRSLPDVGLLHHKIAAHQKMTIETGLQQVQIAEERKQLDDFEGSVAELGVGLSPDSFAGVEPDLRDLLTSRRDLLDKSIAANQIYIGTLSEVELSYNQLLKQVVSFEGFLAEHLLWIRSTPLLRFQDLNNLPKEAAGLVASEQWLATGKVLAVQAGSSPVLLLAGLVFATLIGMKKSILARLGRVIARAAHPATYHFALPLQALGLIGLLALSWPLLLMALSWQLSSAAEKTAFSQAVTMSLLLFSYRFFLLRAFRAMLLPGGLAATFFRWPKTTIALLRRESLWMMVTFLPVVCIVQLAFYANYSVGGSYVFGRLTLIVALGLASVIFYRIFHPRTGVWQRLVAESPNRLVVRLYPFFFLLIVLLPLLLCGLVVAGYVFAVGSLLRCLINSVWATLGIVVCHELVERWLVQSSRRLFRQKALSRHAQVEASRSPGQPALDAASGPVEEPEEDLVELGAESRKLLDTVTVFAFGIALWLVWAEVLPALRFFNTITLWNYTAVVNGQSSTVPVSLADAGLVVLISIITVTATRHFPALLKIVLLQHLDMPPGSRYTATTLSRYLIGGTGLMAIADILGFSWSQVQWLVAALGVGIGFGLQEIVANFISGLIILFERPIRVGDVVTIGNTDGMVTRIRIRATTIRDFDGKELLVPNKEFISGHLLNWSLSDPVIRIMLPVGIAYGSDVQAAMALMMQAARENPLVLEDPPPAVTFDSFGDNALLLTLRFFVGSVDDRVAAKSALHQIIDRKFREAEISMAFPQRDVHLDTTSPLDIRIVEHGQDSSVLPAAYRPTHTVP